MTNLKPRCYVNVRPLSRVFTLKNKPDLFPVPLSSYIYKSSTACTRMLGGHSLSMGVGNSGEPAKVLVSTCRF